MAYPGSQLYDDALKQGWKLPETWSGYSQHAVDTLPLPTKHLSAGEVLAFRDRAFQVYFNNPSLSQQHHAKVRHGNDRADPRDDISSAGTQIYCLTGDPASFGNGHTV